MRLNCIVPDLFRDNPLDHVWRTQIRAPNTVFGVFGPIWGHDERGEGIDRGDICYEDLNSGER